MSFELTALLSCLLLLAGCSGQVAASRLPQAEAEITTTADEFVTVLSLPLAELKPYEPWESMEPDTVSADTMGEILCDKTLPDGTSIVCYWHPDHLTDPTYQFTKYWAVRRGDELLRFCQETSGYDSDGDYDVTPFSDILGQSGFCIKALRGAAYLAYDYYIMDESGVPRLLADCANTVLEGDFNSDGVMELIWFYHNFQEVYYYALLDGRVCFADVTSAFADLSPIYFGAVPNPLKAPLPTGAALPISYIPCGGRPWDETMAFSSLPAQLCFTPEAVEFQVPADQLWTMDCYTLADGVPCVKRLGEADWTPLGPAVPAPQSWAAQELAGRNEAETWAGLSPDFTALQMVSSDNGWLVLSLGRGVGGIDTYVYCTRDGGQTWEEGSPLPEDASKPFKAAFLDSEHAVIATEVFNEAPVYTTSDGGRTWTEAALPLPDAVWRPENLWLDDGLFLSMAANEASGAQQTVILRSTDQGQTWTVYEAYDD